MVCDSAGALATIAAEVNVQNKENVPSNKGRLLIQFRFCLGS